jgi:hypothetical protein
MSNPVLALIPSTVGGSVYSVLPSNGDGDFDFSRASAATRINAQGLIETVAVGDNRLNYPLVGGVVDGCPHLLLEAQRTNLITESAVFSGYSGSNAVITDNSITSPDGTLTGAILADDNAGGTGVIQISEAVTVDVSSAYTWSIFAKKKDLNFIAFRLFGFTTPINDTSFFNLNLGTVVSAGSGQVAEIENYGNGWYRCSITFTTDAADTNGTLQIRVSQDGTSTASVNLDNTSNIYIWGWQFEKSNYASSYIPTSGSAVTVLAETCDNSGNNQLINSTEGVVYCEIASLAETPETRSVLGIGVAGSGDDRVTIEYNVGDTNLIRGQVRTSSLQASIGYVVTSIKDFHKVALAYQLNNVQLWIDGVKRNEDLSADVSSPNTISMAAFLNNNTNNFEGKCKGFRVYDTVLTDAELEALTT